MKVNLLYVLSKISIIAIFAFNFLIEILNLSFIKSGALASLTHLLISVVGIFLIIRIKNYNRSLRLILLIILAPIALYFVISNLMLFGTISYLPIIFGNNLINIFNTIINIFYYFVPSILLMIVYKYEVLSINEKESNIKVPEIVTFVFQIIIFLIPSLIVLSKEFNFELTSILATSGVLAAILGFAIQANLSNMLSGIFVNIERPFSQNDWITIDDKTGFVIDVTWRSTRIRTFENIEVTIPNEVVANAVIVNWSKNDKERMSEGFHIFNKLHFHPKHDPQHISQLLYNALKKVKPIDGREQLNLQWVRFIGVNEYGLEFAVAFDCTDRLKKNSQQDVVMMEIHKTLKHAGISMSAGKLYSVLDTDVGLKALDTHRLEEHYEPRKSSEFNPYNESIKNKVLLEKVPIFMSLSNEEIENVAINSERIHFNKDQYIIKQNDEGDSLFIIADGVVSVTVDNDKGEKVTVSKLGVGDFFGEMSLMTGEPRTANIVAEIPCVVLKVYKDTIKNIFSKNPEIYDYVSNILAKRKLVLDKSKDKSLKENEESKKLSIEIKKAIINFLS